jgi:5-methylcytosine-specific restriction endonuclease McrA
MALKRCLRCGVRTKGSYCPKHARPGSTREWRRTREAVFAFYGPRCECGEPATHVDHQIPWIAGGSDEISNLRPMCAKCNLEKGDR